jgi:hypothetical protein
MWKIDLDRDTVDFACFVIAAILVAIARFAPPANDSDKLYDFAALSAGAALRGLGTNNKSENDDNFR